MKPSWIHSYSAVTLARIIPSATNTLRHRTDPHRARAPLQQPRRVYCCADQTASLYPVLVGLSGLQGTAISFFTLPNTHVVPFWWSGRFPAELRSVQERYNSTSPLIRFPLLAASLSSRLSQWPTHQIWMEMYGKRYFPLSWLQLFSPYSTVINKINNKYLWYILCIETLEEMVT